MKLMIKLLLLTMLTTVSVAVEFIEVGMFFKQHNLDINSKSYMGWVRVLRSKEARESYNIYIDEQTAICLINQLLRIYDLHKTKLLYD